MGSSDRSRRMRRYLVTTVSMVVLGTAGAGLAHAAGGFLRTTPSAAEPGTPYQVRITCDQEPTLYGAPLDGYPAGTLLPLPVAADGPTEWTATATAGEFDDHYGASCGDDFDQTRFDADAPWLHLGPLAMDITDLGRPKTEVGGSDCPPGTTASVSITLDGTRTDHTATIDEYGDWAVPLAAPFANDQSLRVEATCGDVEYAPLVRNAPPPPTPTDPTTPTDSPEPTTGPTGPPTGPTTPTGPTGPTTPAAPPSPTPPPSVAPPAEAQPGQAAYTG